jgi:heme oxygenase
MPADDTETRPARPLPEAIAAATRPVHAKLNKLIIARLPFALPPRATDPALYVSGLLHVAPIYITFESLWRNLLDIPATDVVSVSDSTHSPRLLSVLKSLYLPQLMRSDRLRSDIEELTGWSSHVVEEQLKLVGQSGRLAEFTRHIKRSVEKKPHILVSYAYILFMALFAGGRFIRASLESAGAEFWNQTPSAVLPSLRPCDPCPERRGQINVEKGLSSGSPCHSSHTGPLRFFHFSTSQDGEDLRQEFKKGLAEIETVLTTHEKHDIIQEAICIFDNMALLVSQLDAVCGEAHMNIDSRPQDFPHHPRLATNPLAARLRDSVVVTREREARSSSKTPSGSEDSPVSNFNDQSSDTSAKTGRCPRPSASAAQSGLCPAMAKSMRFQEMPRHPSRRTTGSDLDLVRAAATVSKTSRAMDTNSWIIFVALGLILFGALFTSRCGSHDLL